MTRFISIIIFIIIITIILPPAEALDSTPSADIKTKLEELKKEIASKAAKLKTEVDRKLKDKAYIGSVKQKSSSSLTIDTNSGPKTISLNRDTVFETKLKPARPAGGSKKNFTQKNIALEDFIAGLGDVDEMGVLTAKRVILLPTPNPNLQPKTYLWGQIVSISGKLATLKDKDSKNVALSIPAKFEVKLNDFVILTGNKNKNDIFEAGFVYVITQGGVIKLKKNATPSASVKPLPSPTKKPS